MSGVCLGFFVWNDRVWTVKRLQEICHKELDIKTIYEKNLLKSGVIFASQTFIGARKKEMPLTRGETLLNYRILCSHNKKSY